MLKQNKLKRYSDNILYLWLQVIQSSKTQVYLHFNSTHKVQDALAVPLLGCL